MNFSNYLTHRVNLFRKLFLTQLTRILIWATIFFIENYKPTICIIILWKYFPFTHMSIHIMNRYSDTRIIMTSKRRCLRYIYHENEHWYFVSTGTTNSIAVCHRLAEEKCHNVALGESSWKASRHTVSLWNRYNYPTFQTKLMCKIP